MVTRSHLNINYSVDILKILVTICHRITENNPGLHTGPYVLRKQAGPEVIEKSWSTQLRGVVGWCEGAG